MPRIAVCLCAAVLLTPGAVGAQPYTPTIAVSPNTVSAGGQVTITATIRNDGPTDNANFLALMSFPRELTFVSASAPSGWTVEHLGNIEFHDYTRFGPARLSSHASVTFSVTVGIPATMWPGETISPISLGGTAAASTELVIAGAAPPPATQPQLFVIPATTSILPFLAATHAAYDPMNGMYILVGRSVSPLVPVPGSLVLARALGSGAPTSAPIEIETAFPPPSEPRLQQSDDLSDGITSGGVMLVWSRAGEIFARSVVTQSFSLGTRGTLSEGTSNFTPMIAYSSASRIFLVTWKACPLAGQCSVQARRVGLDGQPIGPVISIGAGADHDVVWNPVTNEFAVVWSSGFARLSTNGAILGRIDEFVGKTLAVNTETGNYVAVRHGTGFLNRDVLAAEISPSGRIISRGWVTGTGAFQPTLTLLFNAISGTFLLSSGNLIPPQLPGLPTDLDAFPQPGSTLIVELNRHGAPLSFAVVEPCAGLRVSRPDAAEWRFLSTACGGVGTFSRNGGSDMRLGGCTTPDPFISLGGGHCYDGGWLPVADGVAAPPVVVVPPEPGPAPPMPPPPSTCAIPDPFVSLGGGTCHNGGWLPPGMVPPPAPAAPPTGCSIPDPFVSLGSGTCRNGGWYPPGMQLPG